MMIMKNRTNESLFFPNETLLFFCLRAIQDNRKLNEDIEI